MVALKTERRVYMWHVAPRPVPVEAPKIVTLEEIIDIIKDSHTKQQADIFLSPEGRVLKDDAPESQRDPANRIYIADIDDREDFITILINRGDPSVTDAAYIHVISKSVRTVVPEPNESPGSSAHLIIKKEVDRIEGKYRACFERMPHVSSTHVESLLAAILTRYAIESPKYFYYKRSRRNNKYVTEYKQYIPSLEIRKVPSDQIKHDIDRGELSSIVLIESRSEFAGPDAPGIVKSAQKRLIIKPKKAEKYKILSFIQALTPWAVKEGFNEIKVNMRSLPGNITASPRFELDQEDATETLYVRSQRLTQFSTMLEGCYGSICEQIQREMISLLNDIDKW